VNTFSRNHLNSEFIFKISNLKEKMEIPEKTKTSLLRLFELMDQSTKEINQNILEIELKRNNFKTGKDSFKTLQVNFFNCC
jgi:hypothetical protein